MQTYQVSMFNKGFFHLSKAQSCHADGDNVHTTRYSMHAIKGAAPVIGVYASCRMNSVSNHGESVLPNHPSMHPFHQGVLLNGKSYMIFLNSMQSFRQDGQIGAPAMQHGGKTVWREHQDGQHYRHAKQIVAYSMQSGAKSYMIYYLDGHHGWKDAQHRCFDAYPTQLSVVENHYSINIIK